MKKVKWQISNLRRSNLFPYKPMSSEDPVFIALNKLLIWLFPLLFCELRLFTIQNQRRKKFRTEIPSDYQPEFSWLFPAQSIHARPSVDGRWSYKLRLFFPCSLTIWAIHLVNSKCTTFVILLEWKKRISSKKKPNLQKMYDQKYGRYGKS